MKKDLLNLLNNIQEHGEETPQSERYLLIDGLNLFFRNFSAINAVNSNGVHIGGLGGFFRSLGALIRTIQPTQVYVVFDGVGSSNNRKNIIPEYKSNRNVTRVTKHELFDNLEEEDDSKVDQIVRIIQYLKTLPVKTVSLPRVEADDIIAYLAESLEGSKVILSVDKDFLQLINENVIVYDPIRKKETNIVNFEEVVKCKQQDFMTIKCLEGDKSDNVPGIPKFGKVKISKYLNREINLTDEEQSIYNRNYSLFRLDKFKDIDNKDELLYYQEQMPAVLSIEPCYQQFIDMCKEHDINNILNKREDWYNLFFVKHRLLSMFV